MIVLNMCECPVGIHVWYVKSLDQLFLAIEFLSICTQQIPIPPPPQKKMDQRNKVTLLRNIMQNMIAILGFRITILLQNINDQT